MSLNEKQIKNLEVKEHLNEEKEKVENLLSHLHDMTDLGDDVDGGDEITDESEEHAHYFGIKSHLETRLEDIEKALEKIEAGEYGDCKKCGNSIPVEIIKIDPESHLCKECKKEDKK
ncbi:MAG: TraR/DksA family transcriptional regulator [Candidatus Magasanikbacteria bacterium]